MDSKLSPATRDGFVATERRLVRAQAISGLLFATFLLLHLANAAAAIAGQGVYDALMRGMRWYYQFPLVEITCVVGAALVHIAVGIARIVRRRRSGARKRPSLRIRLHRLTGYVLMVAFVGHVLATRGVGLLGHAIDYSYVNYVLVEYAWFFYPYYIAFAFSGLYHLAHGVVAALRSLGVRVPRGVASPRSRLFWGWAVAAAALATFAVLALGGDLYAADQHRFDEWERLFEWLG